MTMTEDVCDATTSSSDDKKNDKNAKQKRPLVPTMLLQRSIILLLGDSITQLSFSATMSGWGAHLADVYQRRADVYNRGFSGYNTDWFLRYLETDEGRQDLFIGSTKNDDVDRDDQKEAIDEKEGTQQQRVKLVTIFFGANDASDAVLNARQHVPLEKFQSNLRKLASICKDNYGPDIRVIFITPPPVHHASRLEYQIQRYGKEKATGKLERTLDLSKKYANAVEAVATELGMPCLNIWKEMQESKPNNEEWSIYLSDGLHLSREGNIFVGRRVEEMISNVFPEIAITPCPFTKFLGNSGSKGGEALGGTGGVGPFSDDIDHKNPDAVFANRNQKRKLI